MIRLCLFSAFLVLAPPVLAQDSEAYRQLIAGAEAAYADSAFARSDSLYAAAFEAGTPTAADLYSAASAAALAGRTDRAFALLGDALAAGWEHLRHMERDPDLAALRADAERWEALEAEAAEALRAKYGPGFDPALRAELLAMQEADQEPRRRLAALFEQYANQPPDSLMRPLSEELTRTDSLHLVRLEAIIAERGWPTFGLVGKEGATAAFLIVQHADLEAQERYLPLMEAAVEAGEAAPAQWAMLVDRVRVRQGRPQLYGSQVGYDRETGASYVYPIEDEARVDERRAEVGLGPLAEYLRHFGIEYAPAGG